MRRATESCPLQPLRQDKESSPPDSQEINGVSSEPSELCLLGDIPSVEKLLAIDLIAILQKSHTLLFAYFC